MFTVKHLSQLAGISVRTLHYYDEIGLLKPARVGDNGYRYYDEQTLLRLQQILLYRELDLPLEHIKRLMGRRDFDVLSALEGHKAELARRIARMQVLIATVDQTIDHLKGKQPMSQKQFFEGFNEAQQAEYEKEAQQMYDPATVKESAQKWKGYTAADKERIQAEGNAVYQGFLDAMPFGPSSPQAQACVERWRRHLEYFWSPDPDQLSGLAASYNQDPRFKANFDRIHPQLAEFIRDAAQTYVSKKQ